MSIYPLFVFVKFWYNKFMKVSERVLKRMKMPGNIISLAILIILINLYIYFCFGIYSPLYIPTLLGLLLIPIFLIIGTIFAIIRKKWLALAMGIFFLPPSWIGSMIAAMSNYPEQPSHRFFHGFLLLIAPLFLLLYITSVFQPTQQKKKKALDKKA